MLAYPFAIIFAPHTELHHSTLDNFRFFNLKSRRKCGTCFISGRRGSYSYAVHKSYLYISLLFFFFFFWINQLASKCCLVSLVSKLWNYSGSIFLHLIYCSCGSFKNIYIHRNKHICFAIWNGFFFVSHANWGWLMRTTKYDLAFTHFI